MHVHGPVGHLYPSWVPKGEAIAQRITPREQHATRPHDDAAGRLPIGSTDETIYMAADEAARACYQICALYMNTDAIKYAIAAMCDGYGVPFPGGASDAAIIARALDKSWWLRNLRKEHARRCENESIRIGTTGAGVDAYISKPSAARQARRNRENQALLESQTMTNEKGQTYTVAELAALGMANKAIRRGELMTRIRGFEEIATRLGHVGMFWTLTCPSKFHSVGGTNEKYSAAGSREGQAYLCKIWARMRSALKRRGIRPYGFRIAEPHTDGCPHWHMLFFVEPGHVDAMQAIIFDHAMRMDGDEAGADKFRVTCKNIRTGYGMSAAAYIAKYIAKNIDGHEVGQHTATENGHTYYIQKDMLGREELTPSQRVTYWSQLHGIRQFQQIGGAPVGVWRELRRMTAESVAAAPYEIQQAWGAVQKVATGERDENGDEIMQQADWALYTWAQGGVDMGRACRIHLARDTVTIEGKYETYDARKPIGVYAAHHPDEIYKSVRYTWTASGPKSPAVAVAVALPRTRVNNCTRPGDNAPWTAQNRAKNKILSSDFADDLRDYLHNDHDFDADRYRRLIGDTYAQENRDGAEALRIHAASGREEYFAGNRRGARPPAR